MIPLIYKGDFFCLNYSTESSPVRKKIMPSLKVRVVKCGKNNVNCIFVHALSMLYLWS